MEGGAPGTLNPALEEELLFLRKQVDFWRHQAFGRTRDASPSVNQRYHHAKDDLTKFVSSRRKEGYKI